jgi:hypothetical protein
VRVAVSKGPDRVDVFLPSFDAGNRSELRNVVFFSYLGFLTMDRVHERSYSDIGCVMRYFFFILDQVSALRKPCFNGRSGLSVSFAISQALTGYQQKVQFQRELGTDRLSSRSAV